MTKSKNSILAIKHLKEVNKELHNQRIKFIMQLREKYKKIKK